MKNSIELGPFIGGMNNRLPEDSLPKDQLRNAVNVDITTDGGVRRRRGRTSVLAGAGCHSLWSDERDEAFYVAGGALTRITKAGAAYVTSVVRTGLAAGAKVSYCRGPDNAVYYSNGIVKGRIVAGVDHPWGVELPSGLPTLSAGAGALKAGQYQVCVTFLTAAREESGASLATTISLAENQSLSISAIPQPTTPEVTSIAVYATSQNGETLFRVAELAVGTTTLSITVAPQEGPRLRTQFLAPPPAGQHVREFHGRIAIAVGSMLYFTEPWALGLCDMRAGYYPLPGYINILEPVISGFFVATETKHYWMPIGEVGKNMELRERLPYGAAFGSGSALRNSELRAWYSTRGICVGAPDGTIKNLQESKVAVDMASVAATFFREHDGLRQLVASLSNPHQSAFAATSWMEAEVTRRTTHF